MKKRVVKALCCCLLMVVLSACISNKVPINGGLSSSSVQGELYTNDRLKFQLTFPKSWKNHYLITYYETDAFDCLKVGFIGNSQWSIYEGSDKPTGLAMLYIATEEAIQKQSLTVNKVSFAGNAGNKKFYFYEPTDYPVGGLKDSAISYSEEEEEKELRAQDYKIAVEMEKDIEQIMNSFSPLV